MDSPENNVINNHFSVRKPRVAIYLPIIMGIIDSLFFCSLTALMLIYPNETASIGVFSGFIAFILLGFLLIIIGFSNRRWEIRIDGHQINYTPLFGKAKQFTLDSFSRVQSISHDGWAIGIAEIRFYFGDKVVFAVKAASREFTTLLAHLENENISFS